MPPRLRREEVVTIHVLTEKGESRSAIARTLEVTEGAVRYHLRRAAAGATDGRQGKPYKAEAVAEAIAGWCAAAAEDERPVNVRDLYEYLQGEHDYRGSYKSVVRYMRARYPKPARRTYRRVETVPGAQSQTDWAEYPRVDVGRGPEPLHAFVMVLSHSRKPAVVWSRSEDQLHWLSAHNGGYRRLQGVAAVNRIDNVKTAIATGAGAWGTIHPTYRAYARAVGFHIDACGPREANAKGKAEAKVRLSRLRLDPGGRRYDAVEELQEQTDRKIEAWAKRTGPCARRPARRCRPVGKPSSTSWRRCRSCPSPSTSWSRARCRSTAWCTSRTASTRCRSGSSASGWRCAAVPTRCRSWPTAGSCASTRGGPPNGC